MQIITTMRNKQRDVLIGLAEYIIKKLVDAIVDTELSTDEIIEIANEISAVGSHLKILKNDDLLKNDAENKGESVNV